ncbi:hypothetical protein HYDPIDRAFT_113643 [Hydnomerulius pinastri MD-312]|uniref:Secreted protein n=1 Tax=Hydnomerulius pinastri MD-312 TaxID=994086 RepID=A0A0C9WDJ5_9AGAM|nr:hypothetical protein HYDPIDRAFT_113643 [Hydnomerulius pinastri MD-312]
MYFVASMCVLSVMNCWICRVPGREPHTLAVTLPPRPEGRHSTIGKSQEACCAITPRKTAAVDMVHVIYYSYAYRTYTSY